MSHEDYSIGRFISIIYRYRHSYLSKKLEPYGIGSGQYIFLLGLHSNPGISQDKLSHCLRIDKTTTAKAIKKLMTCGYVDRTIDEKDKRAYEVYLTEKGHSIIPKIIETIKEWEASLTRDISNDNIHIIKELLHEMAHNACHIEKKEVHYEEDTL